MPCHPWFHRGVWCSCTARWAGKPIQEKAMPGKGAWLAQGGLFPAPVHCIDMHLLMPEQGRGQCWVMKKWRRWENETASFGLSADQSVCGTECHVWISWINVVKPWIKSYSGREFSLAYGKQHPQLIQSGFWNTGNKYISLLCFCGSLYNNAWLQRVFSSLSQAALPSLAPQTEILGTATYILAHFWEPSLSLWVDSALQWSLLGGTLGAFQRKAHGVVCLGACSEQETSGERQKRLPSREARRLLPSSEWVFPRSSTPKGKRG